MPKLLEKINQDLVKAMKSKDIETTSVLRMLIAAVRNKEITLRENGQAAFVPSSVRLSSPKSGRGELSDEQAVGVIASEIKKRRDSVEAYNSGGRQELADKEGAEIKILEKYLPEQLSDVELEKIVKEVAALGVKNFGQVMGQVMVKVKGRANGAKVEEMVKKILAK